MKSMLFSRCTSPFFPFHYLTFCLFRVRHAHPSCVLPHLWILLHHQPQKPVLRDARRSKMFAPSVARLLETHPLFRVLIRLACVTLLSTRLLGSLLLHFYQSGNLVVVFLSSSAPPRTPQPAPLRTSCDHDQQVMWSQRSSTSMMMSSVAQLMMKQSDVVCRNKKGPTM